MPDCQSLPDIMKANFHKFLHQMRFKLLKSIAAVNNTPPPALPNSDQLPKISFLKRKIQSIYKSVSKSVKFSAGTVLRSDLNRRPGQRPSRGSEAERSDLIVQGSNPIRIGIPLFHRRTTTKKSAEADLVHLTSLLNGWPDNLESNISPTKQLVKSLNIRGVDLPGVEPGRLGLSDQPSKPAKPTPNPLSQNENQNSIWVLT